ncbi:hypothetical protein [Metasolibacillus meyeri]|uniref:hypothetical protein n=1 Tax=Metasolibacillus meyeri TaxID=1071052 RepID=UPI001290011F|nr:hypothetical protein [Metasolibacillus meyeri]
MKKIISIAFLIFLIAAAISYFKTDTVKGLLKIDSIPTNFTVEKIVDISFENIAITQEQQAEIAIYMESLKLRKIKNSLYSIEDTAYRVAWGTSNSIYFAAPDIIVVPSKSIRGYRIINHEQFLSDFEALLNEGL